MTINSTIHQLANGFVSLSLSLSFVFFLNRCDGKYEVVRERQEEELRIRKINLNAVK